MDNATRARIESRLTELDTVIKDSLKPGNSLNYAAMQEAERLDSALRVFDAYKRPITEVNPGN